MERSRSVSLAGEQIAAVLKGIIPDESRLATTNCEEGFFF